MSILQKCRPISYGSHRLPINWMGPYLLKSMWRSRQAVQSASDRAVTPATTFGGNPSRLLSGSSAESASVRSLPSLQRLSSCVYGEGNNGPLKSAPVVARWVSNFEAKKQNRFYFLFVYPAASKYTMKLRETCCIYI